MAEPLTVDPSRLNAVAEELAGLVFPTPPAPIVATGTDSVSAAINATMPELESLVTGGLPGVKAALTRTASSMSAAADIYTKADQSLGDGLQQAVFGSDSRIMGDQTSRFGKLMGTAADPSSLGQQASELTPRVAATVPQLVQLAPQAGQVASQGAPMVIQTITSTAQQGSSAGATPAQLPADTKKEDDSEAAEGAAAGAQTVGPAPSDGSSKGAEPPTTPSARSV